MEFLYFLGRFHPLLLHLPIGFLVLAFLMELAARKPSFASLAPAIPFTLVLGAASALVTALLGYFLSLEGGYEGSSLNVHKYSGIALVVFASALAYLRIRRPSAGIYMPAFAVTMVLMAVTGHYGGNLTHGSNFLTEHAPSPVRRALGLPVKIDFSQMDLAAIDSFPAYVAITQPILDDKCVSCHNADKRKGELRLDTREAMLEGGEHGMPFVSGQPDSSRMIEMVHLPEQDDLHMPPDGKEQLSEDEIALLEWWIREGADFERKVGQYDKSEEIQEILKRRFEPQGPEGVFALSIRPLGDDALQELVGDSLPLRPVAQESPLLEISLANRKTLDRQRLQHLERASRQLIKLNVSNTPVNDAMMDIIGGFPHLIHLHLDRTRITDDGLESLVGLEYLEYLNLFQTGITDRGLETLARIPSLRKVYLWQTQTTQAGVERLRKALPDAYIDTGMDTDFAALGGEPTPPDIHDDGAWFLESSMLELSAKPGAEIRYTLDGSLPDSTSAAYEKPITIDRSLNFAARAFYPDREPSPPVEKKFIHVRYPPLDVTLETEPDSAYAGLGKASLTDLRQGSAKFRDGNAWLGWEEVHPGMIFDLGQPRRISMVLISSLEDSESWIFFPRGARISVSTNGVDFQEVTSTNFRTPSEPAPARTNLFECAFEAREARYVKVEVQNRGTNPSWHEHAGEPCWVFIDEIIID